MLIVRALRVRFLVVVLALAGCLGLVSAAAASAAVPSVFWANYNAGTISRASLDGSGGNVLNTTGVASGNYDGVAIDVPAHRIFGRTGHTARSTSPTWTAAVARAR